MLRKIRSFIDGDLTDPIINNLLVCIATYCIVVLSFILIQQELDKESSTYMIDSLQIIADSAIPTTITFSLSVIFQNIALAISRSNTKCVLTIINIILTTIYVFYYSMNRIVNTWQKGVGLFVFSMLIVILCFFSLSQIQHCVIQMNKRSLSG